MALWDYNDPAETERRFRELLPGMEASGDTDTLGQLRTQIARTYSLRARFDQAHAELDRIEPMVAGASAALRVWHLLERGRAFNAAGRKDEARPLFVEAWDTARQAGELSLAVDAAHMIAIVEPPDGALAWNLKALKLVESTDDQQATRWRGALYNNIGWTYFERGEHETALAHFEKGLAWRRQQGQAKETRIAAWAVARSYRALGRIDEALAIQQGLSEQTEAAGEDPDGYVYEELGECWLSLGEPGKAAANFSRAYELLSQDAWLVEHEPDRIERLKSLAGR